MINLIIGQLYKLKENHYSLYHGLGEGFSYVKPLEKDDILLCLDNNSIGRSQMRYYKFLFDEKFIYVDIYSVNNLERVITE